MAVVHLVPFDCVPEGRDVYPQLPLAELNSHSPAAPKVDAMWSGIKPVAAAAAALAPTVLSAAAPASNVINLSASKWRLANKDRKIDVPAKLPSQAHLDLYDNKKIENPIYGTNEYAVRWVAFSNWTYSATIADLHAAKDQETFLLFNGLDTFTTIELCNEHVAYTDNQFRQYFFDVSKILSSCKGDPVLSLNFGPAPNITAAIDREPGRERWPGGVEQLYTIPNRQWMRKEQSDFGWDWGGAYSPAGPWQPAYVVQLGPGQVHPRNTLVDVYREGQRNNQLPNQKAPWVLNASIDFLGTLPPKSSLHFTLKDNSNKTTVHQGDLEHVNATNAAITGSTTIPPDSVSQWWPVNMGDQTLYYLTLDIVQDKKTIASVTKRIGFRTIVLNELPVTKEDQDRGIAPGANWHFEINGNPFFAKGSNLIPPDVFWPSVTNDRIKTLFNAVIDGNQNMLRVWSSGAYLPDFAYDLADELGLLLWSEFQFGDALYPVNKEFLSNVYEEAVYQVRRINHHPSLAFWAGGNELENLELPMTGGDKKYTAEYELLFLSTIFPAVFENSRSISYSPSSTSNGFVSLDFSKAPYMKERYGDVGGGIYGETDYYNYASEVAFDSQDYPVGRFSNEFGFHSMPSLQTWRAAIPETEFHFNSETILRRNKHAPPGGYEFSMQASLSGQDQMISAVENWYPQPNKHDSVANFSAWCWTTQVFQADYYTSQIGFYRRGSGKPQRTLGSLYWQLEDQWEAPTWAGIEYGGRWKVLHYRAKDAYLPVVASVESNSRQSNFSIWVTSDLWSEVKGTFSLDWYTWNGEPAAGPKAIKDQAFTINPLNSTQVFAGDFKKELGKNAAKDVVAKISVTATGQTPNSKGDKKFSHTAWIHASALKEAALVDPGLTVNHDAGKKTVTVKATKGIAAWVWIDYPAGAVVTFEDNGFWLGKGEERAVGYTVVEDKSGGKWASQVWVQSIWDNTKT